MHRGRQSLCHWTLSFAVLILSVCSSLVQVGCGTQSRATSYVKLTPLEKARKALDEEDYPLAIELYSSHLADVPDDYPVFPYLAAAYAGAAGFDIVAAATANIGSEGSTSLLDRLNAFLPPDPTAEQLNSMLQAKIVILAMPEDHRDRNNDEISYASGAALQLELYQTSYAIMYLNQFTEVTVDGALDISRLQDMTPADVEVILNNLEEIAAKGGTGVPAGAGEIVAKVDAQPGDTRRDKLINYLTPKPSP